jgi:predicted hydrocarbon binding protein
MEIKVSASLEKVKKILEQYKARSRIDEVTGELLFGQLPVVWARAEFMSNIYTELESLVGESANSVLKRIGKGYGKKFYELLTSGDFGFSMQDKQEVYSYICAETQAIGWGRIEIWDTGDEIVITSKNGLAVGKCMKAHGEKSDAPVDGYFLGYFEGFFNEMHGKRYFCEEEECVAKGDAQCKFVYTVEPTF